MQIEIQIENIGDADSDGSCRHEVHANGNSVGFIDICTVPGCFSEITKWDWNRDFAPDEDWPQEDGEPHDTSQLMEDLAKAIRDQLKEKCSQWTLRGVDNINTAKASYAATK